MSWLSEILDRYLHFGSRPDELEPPPVGPGLPATALEYGKLDDLPAYLRDSAQWTRLADDYLAQLEGPELRATQLLFRVLPRDEVVRFLTWQAVRVWHSDGSYYEISLGRSSNIVFHDPSGRARITYCAIPSGHTQLHLVDVMAAQYLALRFDPADLMKVALRQAVQGPYQGFI